MDDFPLKPVFSALYEVLGLWKETVLTVERGNVEAPSSEPSAQGVKRARHGGCAPSFHMLLEGQQMILMIVQQPNSQRQ